MRRAISAAVLLGIGLLAACQQPTGIPSNAEEFTPPAVFQRWWAMTEACAGTTGNFAAVRWYRVPGSQFRSNGHQVAGFYDKEENKIVLSDSLAAFGAGVRHEMLHAILGVPGHPRDAYQDHCAGVVVCSLSCTTDGGPWQAPAAWVQMKAESLVVKATAELLPTDADGNRWLVIRTRVTNPLPRAIVANMPPTQAFEFAASPDATTGTMVQDAIYSPDSSTYFFKANATKEFTFEMLVGGNLSRYSVPPGEYRFYGGFGDNWTKSGHISVMRTHSAGALEAQTP